MLLLSDRPAEAAQLQRALAAVRPCRLVALQQPAGAAAAPVAAAATSILICDVALGAIEAVERVRAAIGRYRGSADTPVLMLARDPSALTLTQAASLGATFVLPWQTPKSEIVAAVKALLGGAEIMVPAPAPAGDGLVKQVQSAGEALSEIVGAAERQQPITPATIERGGRIVLRAVNQARIRPWLDVVRTYDDITYQHSLLVAGLVAALAQELGLTEATQSMLSQAALVHDIGKAQIPRAILNKAGQLSPEETALMRTHPMRGYRMLAGQAKLDPRLLDIVLHHHEYLNGSGYPDRLSGDSVSRCVRLVTICDIYAALIERRSYKPPAPPEQAWGVLSDMRARLDAPLLRVFQSVVLRP